MNRKIIARVAAITSFVGFGCYGVYAISQMLARPLDSLFFLLFTAIFGFLIAVVPLWSAYLTYRRQYQTLVSIWIGVFTLVVYGLASSALRWTGIQDRIFHEPGDPSGIPFMGLTLTLVLLFLPFWVAGLFFRHTHQLASRFIPARDLTRDVTSPTPPTT